MRVEYAKTALKQIKKLPPDKRIKVLKMVKELKQDPFLGKKLKGEFSDFYSLKIWPYRIIYRLSKDKKTLYVNTVRHRQEAYD